MLLVVFLNPENSSVVIVRNSIEPKTKVKIIACVAIIAFGTGGIALEKRYFTIAWIVIAYQPISRALLSITCNYIIFDGVA